MKYESVCTDMYCWLPNSSQLKFCNPLNQQDFYCFLWIIALCYFKICFDWIMRRDGHCRRSPLSNR
jgi:hypothetical protein